MGNKSIKKTNELLTGQGQRSQGFQDQMMGYGAEDRAYGNASRADINQKYNDLYAGIGDSGFGGGYTAAHYGPAIENAYAGDYRDWANTGGFTPESAQDFRARATSTLPSFYEGLRNQMSASNAAAGGNVGFNSQMAKLAREKAYGSNQVASNAEADLADRIRSGRQWGISGGSGLDEALIARKMQIERENIAAQQAAAAGNRGSRQQAFNDRMAILSGQRQLRGESGSDLPYFGEGAAYGGQATGNFGSRQKEPGFWDYTGGLIGKGIGAVAGGFSPSFLKKKPSGGSGPMPSEYGYG